ncbi:glycosyltransferase family 9 protein, partial [Acidobacteriota bacterium]
ITLSIKSPRVIALSMGGKGDLVQALLALSRLRGEGRSPRLTLVTDSLNHDAGVWCDLIDNVIARKYRFSLSEIAFNSENPSWSLFKRHPGFFMELKARQFDLGVVLGPSEEAALFGARFLELVGAKERIGLIPKGAERLLDRFVTLDLTRSLPELYKEAVELAAPFPMAPSVLFPPNDTIVRQADRIMEEAGIKPEAPFVVINPGAGRYINLKRWAPERFGEIAGRLRQNFGLPVLVTGGRGDKETIQRMTENLTPPPFIAAMRSNIAVDAQLIKRSVACLTNDTVVLHIALALEIPLLYCVFGPSAPDNILPLEHRCRVFQSKRPCVPCEKVKRASQADPCPIEPVYACLADISVDEVWRTMEKDLEKALA